MTKLLYLSDSYQETETAQVLDVREHEKGLALILDQTIFYPQGGGQPCDQGTIKSGDNTFEVSFTALDPDGIVWHIGQFANGEIQAGDTVDLKIDIERRMLNTKCHTAGHLIDIAVGDQSTMNHLVAGKGFHFPEGPYVEYKGEIENPSEYIEAITAKCQEVVTQDIAIIAESLSPEEAQKRDIWAPPGKSARFVYFEGYEKDGCGCGGTHVRKTGELGSITIRKISSKKGVTRVAYQVD